MRLNDVKPKHPGKDKKPRIGRGGKRGYSSGRGQKGQKSRAGHRIRPAERDLIIRIPKLRGYKNKPRSAPNVVVNLSALERLTENVVTKDVLVKNGLLKKPNLPVKILDGGEIKRDVEIKGIPTSAGAKKKIEAAGGKVLTD